MRLEQRDRDFFYYDMGMVSVVEWLWDGAGNKMGWVGGCTRWEFDGFLLGFNRPLLLLLLLLRASLWLLVYPSLLFSFTFKVFIREITDHLPAY